MRARPVLVGLAGVILAFGLAACSDDESLAGPLPPADWQEIRTCSEALRFSLAPDMTLVSDDGIDSCVRVYEGPASQLDLDYGLYSADWSVSGGGTDLTRWTEAVDGRTAHFVTATHAAEPLPFFAAMSIDPVWTGEETRFAFASHAATEAERDEMLMTFRSLNFSD